MCIETEGDGRAGRLLLCQKLIEQKILAEDDVRSEWEVFLDAVLESQLTPDEAEDAYNNLRSTGKVTGPA